MTKKSLELKLETLLNEFQSEHGLLGEEIYAIANTMTTLIYSDRSTRNLWYKEMVKVSTMISKALRGKANEIIASLNLSEEEKEKMMKKIKEKMEKKDKVEN
jgi:hypothetical protein